MSANIKFLSVVLLLQCLWVSVSCAKSDEVNIGDIGVTELLRDYPIFAEEFTRYQVTDEEKALMMALQGKALLVMFGTWCHDSEREVPRLLKLIEQSGVELANLQLLAVDVKKNEPTGLAQQHRLKYTPTIVLFDGANELGRVIEKPGNGLANDLAMLLK